jgi:hypothetical protein
MISAITGSNQPIYLVCRQATGQPREAPVGHGGYGEVIAGFSAEAEKSQKRPKGGNQLLRCRNATLAGAFQKKVSYGLRFPLADVLAERPE